MPATGRDKFARVRGLLLCCAAVMRPMPTFINRWLWVLTNATPDSVGVALRYILLKAMAKRCGDNVYVGRYVEVLNANRLELGDNISLHAYCYVDAAGGVTIGSDVSIAHASSLISFDHTWDDPDTPIKYNPVAYKPIVIEDDVWLGCGVRVLCGLTIGKRSIVAAGAVVNKDVPAGWIVGGVPAKPLKEIA